jgi:hypothetical protein
MICAMRKVALAKAAMPDTIVAKQTEKVEPEKL